MLLQATRSVAVGPRIRFRTEYHTQSREEKRAPDQRNELQKRPGHLAKRNGWIAVSSSNPQAAHACELPFSKQPVEPKGFAGSHSHKQLEALPLPSSRQGARDRPPPIHSAFAGELPGRDVSTYIHRLLATSPSHPTLERSKHRRSSTNPKEHHNTLLRVRGNDHLMPYGAFVRQLCDRRSMV